MRENLHSLMSSITLSGKPFLIHINLFVYVIFVQTARDIYRANEILFCHYNNHFKGEGEKTRGSKETVDKGREVWFLCLLGEITGAKMWKQSVGLVLMMVVSHTLADCKYNLAYQI